MTDQAAAEGPFTREDAVREIMAANAPEPAAEVAAPAAVEPAEVTDQTEADPITAEDAASEEETPGDDGEDAEIEEPEAPAVDAPHWWTAEQKATWAELSPEHQNIILEQETNRERAVSKAKQEAAEARKKAEQESAGLGQYRQAVEHVLQSATQTFKSKWDGVDWAAWADQDPVAAFQGKTLYEKEAQELQQLETARQASETLHHRQHLQTEAAKLADVAPDLADPEKGNKRRQEVGSFLLQNGIDQTALNWISASEMAIAYDAMRYRQLQANAKSALAKPKSAPPAKPTVKPAAAQTGTSQQRDVQRLQNRLNQTRSREDAVALILAKGL